MNYIHIFPIHFISPLVGLVSFTSFFAVTMSQGLLSNLSERQLDIVCLDYVEGGVCRLPKVGGRGNRIVCDMYSDCFHVAPSQRSGVHLVKNAVQAPRAVNTHCPHSFWQRLPRAHRGKGLDESWHVFEKGSHLLCLVSIPPRLVLHSYWRINRFTVDEQESF